MDLKFLVHYSFHFIVPGFVAFVFYKNQWKKVYLICLAAMLIDLDHLFATPIFSPNRCSINFHPLHTYYAILCYFGLTLWKKTRILGIALLLHILADTIDCLL